MDSNSNELDFIYYFNKSLILIEHVDIYYQKQILDDIKRTTNELNNLFSKNYFDCEEKRKNKLLETINKYLDDTINNQIIYLINIYKRENQKDILNNCEKKLRNILEIEKDKLDNKLNKKISNSVDNVKDKLYKNINYSESNTKNIEYLIQEKIEYFFIKFEKQIKNDIDSIINDQLYNDINSKIEINNSKIQEKVENFLKIFFKDENFYKKIINKVKVDLNEIYSYINENNEIISDYKKIKKLIDHNENNLKNIERNIEKNIFKTINTTLENKIVLLSNIFNEKISNIMVDFDRKFKNNDYAYNNVGYRDIEKKMNNLNFSKNNFKIEFDKENNEIKLYYFGELISNTKINIKGMIGPKGPQGIKGEKGDVSIIRKIEINKDSTYKFTIQSGTNIYDINSDSKIPHGPSGPKGDKGEPGDVNIKLNWNQDDVIKINKENLNNLNFLKSISVGENSHCMENDSLSIGSGICYKENSITLGNNSKTLNENSIAFFGSTIGKNSFSFLSENVEENSFSVGDFSNDNYNIESIHLNSKKIFLNCDELVLNENKIKDKKILNLEERINKLESEILLINS